MSTQPPVVSQSGLAEAGISPPAAETALVQAQAASRTDVLQIGAPISQMPVEIDVSVPIRKFRVRDLLTLTEGGLIASQWIEGEDLPLAAPGAQLAWTEFEVIDERLAVRITRLV
jgi:flagellar motor switch/type III secretory pathway protein FliN